MSKEIKMTKTERNETINAYIRKEVPFATLESDLKIWNAQVRLKLCRECGQNPAEKEGVCQPCLDYRSHYGI